MKSARSYYLIFALLVAAMGIAFVERPLINAYLIVPIARVLWLAVRVLLIVDQQVYWFLLLFAGFILGALMIPSRQERLRKAGYSQPSTVEDRVAHWKGLFRSAGTDEEARLALEQNLKNLRNSIQPFAPDLGLAEILLPPVKRRFWPAPSQNKKLAQSVEPILVSMEIVLEIQDDRPTEPYDR